MKTEIAYSFSSDSLGLHIALPNALAKGDTVMIRITYKIANPSSGLHFINTDGYYSDRPLQVWTQNEPNEIRYWLPTIDHPSEKSTVEFWLTVPDSLETIATGITVEKKGLGNGKRQDYWVLNYDQSPYVWGFVIGNFSSSIDTYLNKPLLFYTDPAFEKYQSIMYKGIPDMLAFMENYTEIAYPFDVLRFVPIHEFESAGMENVGMITLFDDAQFDSVAHVDIKNTNLLLHEIAHQWFGNYITVNDWSEVTLQEGLVSWFELEYIRQRKGEEAKFEEKWWVLQNYLYEANSFRRPIITKKYESEEQLFDAHTYQKSALVFDLLFNEIGEARFKEVIKEWLKVSREEVNLNRFQTIVEREAGKPMAYFFNQWYLKAGHPSIRISFYNSDSTGILKLEQIQSIKKESKFNLSIPVTLVYKTGHENKLIHFSSVDTLIKFTKPLVDVWIDPNFTIPMEIEQSVSQSNVISRLNTATTYIKLQTISHIIESAADTAIIPIVKDLAVNDASLIVRSYAMNMLLNNYTAQLRDFMMEYLKSDQEGYSRITAVYALGQDSAKVVDALFEKQVELETSYFVKAEMIKAGLIRNGSSWIPKVATYVSGTSYGQVLKSAIAQGLKNRADSSAFDVLINLASDKSPKNYVLDAMESLINLSNLSTEQDSVRNNLLKVKASDPNRTIKIIAYTELAKNPENEEWIRAHIASLSPEDREWILSVLSNPLEIEVEKEEGQ